MRAIKFIVGWVAGMWVLNKLVFTLLVATINSATHVTSFVLLLTVVFTVVYGVVVSIT